MIKKQHLYIAIDIPGELGKPHIESFLSIIEGCFFQMSGS